MKTVVEMAIEAGAKPYVFGRSIYEIPFSVEKLKDFAALVRAEEREACAKVAEAEPLARDPNAPTPQRRIAAAIRARGNP